MKDISIFIKGLIFLLIGPFYFISFAQTQVTTQPTIISPPKQKLPKGIEVPVNKKPAPKKTVVKKHITYSKEGILGKRHYVGLGIGQSFLFSDYANLGEDQITFDLFYQFKSSLMFKLIGNIHAHKFELGQQNVKTKSVNFGIKAKIFDYDKFAPFFGGGLGFYWIGGERVLNPLNNTVTEASSKTTFGLNAFTGLELDVSTRVNISFMAHFHKPFGVSFDGQPDISGSYMKLLIIPSYRF